VAWPRPLRPPDYAKLPCARALGVFQCGAERSETVAGTEDGGVVFGSDRGRFSAVLSHWARFNPLDRQLRVSPTCKVPRLSNVYNLEIF
jgi:hypothetical protein